MLFYQDDDEGEGEDDVRPIDEDVSPKELAGHNETPDKEDCRIWQSPILAPMPEDSRQDIERDDEPVPIGTRECGKQNQMSHHRTYRRVQS